MRNALGKIGARAIIIAARLHLSCPTKAIQSELEEYCAAPSVLKQLAESALAVTKIIVSLRLRSEL